MLYIDTKYAEFSISEYAVEYAVKSSAIWINVVNKCLLFSLLLMKMIHTKQQCTEYFNTRILSNSIYYIWTFLMLLIIDNITISRFQKYRSRVIIVAVITLTWFYLKWNIYVRTCEMLALVCITTALEQIQP